MIVPMIKYDLVMLTAERDAFLEELQRFGVVDLTLSDAEPTPETLALMASIEQSKATEAILAQTPGEGQPFNSADEALEAYRETAQKKEMLAGKMQKTLKEAADGEAWGDFSPEVIARLTGAGIRLRFFVTAASNFDANIAEWEERFDIEAVSRIRGEVHFVVVSDPDKEIYLDAQEVREPQTPPAQLKVQAAQIEAEIAECDKIIARAAQNAGDIARRIEELSSTLSFEKATQSGKQEAEGALTLVECWCPKPRAAEMDAFIGGCPGVVSLSSTPTPEDNTPVLLKNKKYPWLFEFIGDFYALPKYGTMDLTPYFAPFYMIFFAFCLGDAGYGLILALAGLGMQWKGGPKLRQVAGLTITCGIASVVFGFFTGSCFGSQLMKSAGFLDPVRKFFLSSDTLFYAALGLGVVQLLLGMALKVVNTSRLFGFRYALSTIGWMTLIAATVAVLVLPMAGVKGLSMNSPAYLVVAGISLILMFFFNSPGKNPAVNFGLGLWNTYNDVVGFMGDFLSYIRLFAIGLSGGTLATVFNDVAFGMSPDIPVLGQLVTLLILLFGHGINLFMSILGSFVHPLRLTFLEFYKNAGFEGAERIFTPFAKNNTTNN